MDEAKEIVEDEVKLEEETQDEVIETEPDGTESEDESDDSTGEEDKPAWLEQDDDEPSSVPLASHLKTKRKYKGQISELSDENEQLKAKLQNLKSSVQPTETLKRPRERDFDTDEEFDAAIDKYEADRDVNILNRATQSNTQKDQENKFQQKVERGVTNHNVRVDEFTKKHGIDRDVYDAADNNVRDILESVRPGFGNQNYNVLVSKLGPGSEKVILYLGKNPKKLKEFESTLIDDFNGIEASMLLGEIKQIVKSNKKQTSQARKPAAHVSGDKVISSNAKEKAAKKKYDAAKTPQEVYDIRSAARKDGIDVGKWG